MRIRIHLAKLRDPIASSQLQTQQESRYKRWEIAFWVFGALVGLVALF